ncbi:Oidioi.mRNA.OKI2018_I69.chr2.g4801.t1.cds [Oikopleura dioica]|uniref:Oidioi.mRNA.OKI2018_I69.chr2.g4801.t1.cds n=1 Tax=Oikopleura dioica TaxID=34765 RepID=A0ABN7SYF3_OIKDI|nr:Oidioi.mRNA.OKI2018_I69.chr2.g4801.t1.cds [Oikopleura dioica]
MSDTEDTETSSSSSSSSESDSNSSGDEDERAKKLRRIALAKRRAEKRKKKQEADQGAVVNSDAQVITTQPVVFTQGAWVRPDLCGLCFDSLMCYACWCTPCARAEVAEMMGGSYAGAFLFCMFFPCFAFCTLCSERDRIRMRFNIPKTDGCCTVMCCNTCVMAQHMYQLRAVRVVPQYPPAFYY